MCHVSAQRRCAEPLSQNTATNLPDHPSWTSFAQVYRMRVAWATDAAARDSAKSPATRRRCALHVSTPETHNYTQHTGTPFFRLSFRLSFLPSFLLTVVRVLATFSTSRVMAAQFSQDRIFRAALGAMPQAFSSCLPAAGHPRDSFEELVAAGVTAGVVGPGGGRGNMTVAMGMDVDEGCTYCCSTIIHHYGFLFVLSLFLFFVSLPASLVRASLLFFPRRLSCAFVGSGAFERCGVSCGVSITRNEDPVIS